MCIGFRRKTGLQAARSDLAAHSRDVSRRWRIERIRGLLPAFRSDLDRLSVAVILAIGVSVGIGWAALDKHLVDAVMYWKVDLGHLYGTGWAYDSYVYPPPTAQLVALVRPLGWPVFVAFLTFGLFAATAYYGRRWALFGLAVGFALWPLWDYRHPLGAPLLYPLIGNIQPVLAAAIVAGFRWPALWSIPILTKIGPGIGVLWFAFRGEWRSFAVALGATALIAGVSFVLAPGLWWEFARYAVANAGDPSPIEVLAVPLWVRIPACLGLLWWGARTDRRWVVPIASGFAALALYTWSWTPFALAALWLWSDARSKRQADDGDRRDIEGKLTPV
jgi:hypothetical protein